MCILSEPVLRFGASLFWSKQFFILVDGYESVNDAPTPAQNRTSISRLNEFQLHGSSNLCSVGASLFLHLKNISINCHSLCYKMSPQSSRTEPNFHFAVERVPTSWKSEPGLRGGFTFFALKNNSINWHSLCNKMTPPLPHRTELPFRGGTSSNFMEVRTCAPLWGFTFLV